MSANTTTGNNQSYDPGQGIRIFEGLVPDVVLIQEFNYGDDSPATIRGFVDATFGTTFAYTREATVGIPNGVISRYPILESGTYADPDVTNRSFVWARLDVPGPRDLWAVSVHLLTSDATVRNDEATALLADLQQLVPAGEMLVVGGDFNTKLRDEPCIVTLSALVDASAPYPADNLGNDTTNGVRSHPYDWILPTASLRVYEAPVVIGQSVFATGLVFDSRVYTPLSEVAPVMVNDSDPAPPNNMQHMAVVRDFLLPL
jgi:endonuclease/exonuclease/phosphatase family metal-dependent hydrolase